MDTNHQGTQPWVTKNKKKYDNNNRIMCTVRDMGNIDIMCGHNSQKSTLKETIVEVKSRGTVYTKQGVAQ